MRSWKRQVFPLAAIVLAGALVPAASTSVAGSSARASMPVVIVNGHEVHVQPTTAGPAGRIILWGSGTELGGALGKGTFADPCRPFVRLLVAGGTGGGVLEGGGGCGSTGADTTATLPHGGGFRGAQEGPKAADSG